jgi:hypothetical protein
MNKKIFKLNAHQNPIAINLLDDSEDVKLMWKKIARDSFLTK